MTRKLAIQIIRLRRVPLMAIGALIALNIVAYGLLSIYFRPLLSKVQGEWFAKRRTIATERDQSRPALYASGQKDMDEWRSRIIAKKDFAPFLSRLFALAGKHNLQLAGITYKPTVESGRPLTAYTIGFSAKGKYAAVKAFLSDVMALREMVVVDSVTFSSNAQAVEEQVELRMQLTSYFKVGQP